MEKTVLPIFRVGGIEAIADRKTFAQIAAQLRKQWQQKNWAGHFPAFSRTVYCVYQHEADERVRVLVGQLLTNGDLCKKPKNPLNSLPKAI